MIFMLIFFLIALLFLFLLSVAWPHYITSLS